MRAYYGRSVSSATDVEARVARLTRRLAQLDPGARSATAETRIVRAPGRINLIGEHTDYNLGYVLPAAISLETWIASVPRDDGRAVIVSMQEAGEASFSVHDPGTPTRTWSDYVAGVAITLGSRGVQLRGVTAVIDSAIPLGSGLSSSAALELASAWTLSLHTPPPVDPLALARAAQQAENEYVGVQCGLMDQFASAFGRAGHALLLDCRSFDHQSIPLPASVRLVAIDTRTPHRLSASEYNARRTRCERGVAVLATLHPGVESLRDVTPEMLRDAAYLLDPDTLRCCRHVVDENQRVLDAAHALVNGQLELVGQLMAASHASLRDLYHVSSTELDALVEIASSVRGVVGARMTGAGFGGCTVNLVRPDAVEELQAAVTAQYPPRSGRQAAVYVLDAVDGAGVVE